MGHSTKPYLKLQNFDITYAQTIRPKLEALDLFIKLTPPPYKEHDVSSLLGIDSSEVTAIMKKQDCYELNSVSLFHLITDASSEFCKLITRQWHYNREQSYNAEMIADIYNLNIHKVESAFNELNVSEVSVNDLHEVFKRIHTTIFAL